MLHLLFTPSGLLRDSDQDGIADGVAAFLVLNEANAGAIDLAARLGLEVTGLTLPIAGPTLPSGRTPVYIGTPPGINPPFQAEAYVWHSPVGLVVSGEMAARWLASAVLTQPVEAAIAGEEGIQVLVSGQWRQWDGPEAAADFHLQPAKEASTVGGLGDLFGTVVERQIVVPPEAGVLEIAVLCDLAARMGVEAREARFPIGVREEETGRPLIRWAPAAPDQVILHGDTVDVGGREAMRYLALHFPYVGGWGPGHPDLRALSHPPAPALEPGETSLELTWSGERQVDRFWRQWAEVKATYPDHQPDQTNTGRLLEATAAPVRRPIVTEVDLRLNAPRAVRELVRAELQAQVPGAGVQVRSAYKQGYCWVEDEVLPRLRAVCGVKRIGIKFRRFEGKAPADERVLEMPIRWLQELYPVDDLLAAALGLDAAQITFHMAEEGPTYVLSAYGADGEVLFRDTFEAVCGLRRYMDGRPEQGWAHPPTGWLTVRNGGQTLVSEPIDSEVGQFWDWYQSEVLPRVRDSVAQLGPTPESQPFFSSLEIHVKTNDENRRLGIREEQISPLDALHEDLYFFTLDWFDKWGRERCASPFTAPGAILPWVSEAQGAAPRATVRLVSRAGGVHLPPRRPITGLRLVGGRVTEVRVGEDWVGAPAPHATLPAPSAGVPLDEVIGPDQLPPILAYLSGRPGVRVWQAGRSLLGRPCWALEVRLPAPEAIQPPQKQSAFKPVLMINARHHANEVSSTNAVLRLAELAATGDPIVTPLLRRCTLVINPLENMDGAATHYAMAAQQPTWKLHAARFNAAGLEYYREWTNPDTIYGEARVVQDLFAAYLPDIYLDSHGVPSHEWVQPYSGYSSAPYFRVSYWLPNAVLYGIFRDVPAETHPAQAAALPVLRQILTARVGRAPELYNWNQLLMDRYIKYGHAWDPEKFPLEVWEGMICYTWSVRGREFSVLYPETCVLDWVTEVPDETAQGDHLRLCTSAHLQGHLASMEFLNRFPQPVRTSRQGDIVRVGRRRPYRFSHDSNGAY